MPYGRYPERVKPFRKWSSELVDKATINNSATSSKFRRKRRLRRKRRSTTEE